MAKAKGLETENILLEEIPDLDTDERFKLMSTYLEFDDEPEDEDEDGEAPVDPDVEPDDEEVNPANQSLPIFGGLNPETEELLDAANRREAEELRQKSQFLYYIFKRNINEGDGESSKEVLKNLKIVWGKSGTIIGASYKGKKIFKRTPQEKGKFVIPFMFSGNMSKSFKKIIDDFQKTFKKAEAEHNATADGQIETIISDDELSEVPPSEVAESIRSESITDIVDRISEISDELEITRVLQGTQTKPVGVLSLKEARELGGILKIEQQTGQTPLQQVEVITVNRNGMVRLAGSRDKYVIVHCL